MNEHSVTGWKNGTSRKEKERTGKWFALFLSNRILDPQGSSNTEVLPVVVTVQLSNIPRGVTLRSQRDPEICGRQAAKIAACVHAFVTVKPEG